MTWREELAPRIAKIIAEVGRDDMKRLRKALACPTGYRGYWPQKVWNSEVNYQLGITETRKKAEAKQLEEAYEGKTMFD